MKVWQQMSKRAVELAGVGLLAEKNPHTRWGGIGRCGGQWEWSQRGSLQLSLRYNYELEGEQDIRYRNLYIPKWQKKLLFNRNTRPVPKVVGDLHDVLTLPGLDRYSLMQMQTELILNPDVRLGADFVGFYLYNLTKNNILLDEAWKKIDTQIALNKVDLKILEGEYKSRAVFGCLYGLIRIGKMDHVDFLLAEIAENKLGFTLSESIEIVEALTVSPAFASMPERHAFWEEHFKKYIVERFPQIKLPKLSAALRLFDAFNNFEYYNDQTIWKKIFSLLERKKGWARTTIIEKIYPLTGTFPEAEQLFNHYYTQLSTNANIEWRYNLPELRLYTSEEMIAKSQENIQMKPSLRYLIPRRDAEKLNIQYEKWKMTGAIKVENEIIKDKSQSLAYAVKDRYENLKRDGVDFSEMTKEEFKDLFGDFDEEFLTKPIVIEAPNKVEGELSLKQIGLNEFPIEYRRYLEKEKNPKVRKPPKRPKPSNKPKAASPVNPAIPSASEPETPAEADNPEEPKT